MRDLHLISHLRDGRPHGQHPTQLPPVSVSREVGVAVANVECVPGALLCPCVPWVVVPGVVWALPARSRVAFTTTCCGQLDSKSLCSTPRRHRFHISQQPELRVDVGCRDHGRRTEKSLRASFLL